jgi:hypothetical protein
MINETLSKQKKVKCSDTKSHTVIRNLAIALKKPYIQANPLNSFEWIILDIDHENTYIDDLSVKPNIIVYNKDNNKAHYYFKIKAVHNNDQSSYKALEYYQAVKYGLNILLGGDLAFTQTLSKNPLATEHFRVLEVHNKEYELSELAEYCELVPKYRIKAITDVSERAEILGRNQSIFDVVRVEAYKMNEPTEEQIRAIADSYNNNLTNPLDTQEIKHIAKSIAKYVSRPKTQATKKWLEERAKNNNKKSQLVRKEKAQIKKDKAYILFANPKYKLQEIANKLEISIQQTKRYKAEYKKVSFTNQVVPSLVAVGTSYQNRKATGTDNYLSDTFSLYAEREDTEKIPINTINRLLE